MKRNFRRELSICLGIGLLVLQTGSAAASGLDDLRTGSAEESGFAEEMETDRLSETKEDLPVLMETHGSVTYVFENESIRRAAVSTITFLDSIDDETLPVTAWDVSADGDGSIMAWVEKNDDDFYDLYVAGEGGVMAPESCRSLFSSYVSVTEINFGDCFDTSQVTNMVNMFRDCGKLTSLDLSCFNTELVEDMSYMFCECENLEEVTGLSVARTVDRNDMFYGTKMY